MIGANPRSRTGFSINGLKVKHLLGCCCLMFCCIIVVMVLFAITAPFVGKQRGPSAILGSVPMGGEDVLPDCWIPAGRSHCAPSFIIAGAMKCGTTSMFTYLLGHPNVLPLQSYELDPRHAKPVVAEKEVRFFSDPNWSMLVEQYGQEAAINLYLDLFPEIPPPGRPSNDPEIQSNMYKITGEGSPMYICQPGVARRLHDVLPRAKVIIMLRNPVDRSYSEFWFKQSLSKSQITMDTFKRAGLHHEDVFEKCLKSEMRVIDYCIKYYGSDERDRYGVQVFSCVREITRELQFIKDYSPKCSREYEGMCIQKEIRQYCLPGNAYNSMYGRQLPEWVHEIPREQLMFIASEEFFTNTTSVMRETASFLNLSYYNWDQVTGKTFNIVNEDPKKGMKLSVGTNQDIYDKYAPISSELRARLNNWFKKHNDLLLEYSFGPKFLGIWNSMT